VHLDKTIEYNSSLTTPSDTFKIGRGALIRQGTLFKDAFHKTKTGFATFLNSEISIIRTVMIVSTIACFIFGYMSDNQYHFQTIAYIQAVIGINALILSATPWGKANIRMLGNMYIYALNICNIINVALCHFNDKISYQFIIYFFVTNLFFNRSKDLIVSILINTALILALVNCPSENSSSLSDFYLSYIISAFALAVLMLKRFKTEAQLAENEQKYRLLAENSADVICTHTLTGEFDFVSPSIAALTGYHPAELKGKYANSFVYHEDRALYNAMMNRSDAYAGSDTLQYRFLTKTGNYMWLETVVRGFGDHMNTNEARFLSQTRSFQRHHEYLEQIERNAAELQDSYKDLEMFAYISSHDMQEPLRMISNYMQLLKRKYATLLDKDAMEYIDFAVKGASNLQALIKDLLSYSTINKKEINVTPIDIEMVLDDVLSGLQLLMQERNVKVYINEPLLPVMADKNAITQLLQNLIQNGIKYNISAIPVIRISCAEDAKWVTYTIEDNGIGIDKQYAQQIFEPFQRLHNKHNFPGTGLGLSICRKIIDRLNGKIWVESEQGNGSSFYFSIPK
jgi:PAS domain S-box-containing protein